MTLAGLSRFIFATAIVWISAARHLADRQRRRAAASACVRDQPHRRVGLIFGWLAFLIVFGFFTRKAWEIVVGVIVLFVYGGILLGVLPGTAGVSWQGHLLRRGRGRRRRVSAVRARAQGPRA